MRATFWFRTLILAVCAVVLGSGVANAEPPTSTTTLHVDGHLELAPGLEIFHVQTDATQPVGEPVSGSFAGAGELRSGPIDVPIPLALSGPVTCLQVHGSTVSFLYAVDSAQPAILGNVIAHTTSVLFTITKGAPSRVGFVGPLPTGFFHGCGPIGTPFVFNGTVDLSGANNR